LNALATERDSAIDACVAECLPRIGGAAMAAIDRLHVIVAGMRSQVANDAMLERKGHMPERMTGLHVAESLILDELQLHLVVERHGGESFDHEQLEHDVREQLRKKIRQLI
jgi:hypothetical protein